jgi:hypothetical protein
MLEEIDRDIWIGDGPSVTFLAGFAYPTRMTLGRLHGGDLWVCSPIPRDAELRGELDSLGPVRHLVSPNKLHHLFLGDWSRAFPEARLYASPGLKRRRRDLAFHAELGDTPDSAWATDLDQVVFRGSFAMEEVVFFHRASRTAIVTDLVQRFPDQAIRGWRGRLMRLDGLVGPQGSTPREWRLTFWNRRAARAARSKALAWNPHRLVVAHGEWARDQGQRVLESALAWLG